VTSPPPLRGGGQSKIGHSASDLARSETLRLRSAVASLKMATVWAKTGKAICGPDIGRAEE
jgi:hypothetical protein